MELFLTCGYGLEVFSQKELLRKCGIVSTKPETEGSYAHGKVFFNIPYPDPHQICNILHQLKTVERLFGITGMELIPNSISRVCDQRNVLNHIFHFITTNQHVKERMEQWANVKREVETMGCDVYDERESHPPYPKCERKELLVAFRVNVRVSGLYRRIIDERNLSKSIGSAIVKTLTSWRISLRRPEVELIFYLGDDGILMGIPLCRRPLSERPYLKWTGVRATVAVAMASLLLSHLPSHESVYTLMDPLCGTALLLVELAKEAQLTNRLTPVLIGMDSDPDQLDKAVANVENGRVKEVMLIRGDSRNRFPVGSLDGILTDLPFGFQHGNSEAEVKNFLPLILSGMNSALLEGGVIVFLISLSLTHWLETQGGQWWNLLEKYPVKLGELPANILLFRKGTHSTLIIANE